MSQRYEFPPTPIPTSPTVQPIVISNSITCTMGDLNRCVRCHFGGCDVKALACGCSFHAVSETWCKLDGGTDVTIGSSVRLIQWNIAIETLSTHLLFCSLYLPPSWTFVRDAFQSAKHLWSVALSAMYHHQAFLFSRWTSMKSMMHRRLLH